ncbi:proteoglycan 4b [Brachyhypopomus gauderio]|uniref:proteoglycan 4b n=1 Tax=Brachyhypopomus gauderio TaxID=698409 RepID=UPI004042019E
MTRPSYLLLVLACVLVTCCSAQKSCAGRCGESYYRGSACQCDAECLAHNECCRNYEALCTTRDSCKGRCGERFKRGRKCHCDTACVQYDQCCPDYASECTVEESNSIDEEGDESEVDPQASEDLNYPEAEVVVGTTPAVVDSGSGGLSSSDMELEPAVVQPSPLPDRPDVDPDVAPDVDLEPSEVSVTPEVSQAGGDISPHPEDTDTPTANTSVTSFLPPGGSTPETADVNRPEMVPGSLTTTPATPTSTPASEQPVQSTQPSPQGTSETRATTASTAHTNNTEIDASNSTSQPSDLQQPNNTLAPETAAVTQAEHAEHFENVDSETVEIQNKDPTEKPSSTETNTNAQDDNMTVLPSPEEDKPEPVGPSSGAELRPTNPDQPGEAPLPEDSSQPHTLQDESGPSEKTPSTGVDTKNVDPTDTPSTTNNEGETVRGISSTKETPTTPGSPENPSPPTATQKPTKPKSDTADALDEGSPWDYQADANNDTNLCSGRPINGLTTLRNGTIAVFRGHYFWILDSKRNPGPAQGITDVWGIPSPIDTVYTRCNCQGKTYFFKGNQYWRFENALMDPGFPKPVSEGFGLGGHITAALSMPRYRSRRESVLFFKRGGLAQRYTYRIAPQCGSKLAVYTTSRRVRRSKDPELGQEISIRSWTGFPPLVTSAVSVPTTTSIGDGYKYYIFSQTKYYSLKLEGETPVILTPKDGPGKHRTARSWFRCPETPSM